MTLKETFEGMRGKYAFSFTSPQETQALQELMDSCGETSIFSGSSMPEDICRSSRYVLFWNGPLDGWYCGSTCTLPRIKIGDFI